MTVKAYNVAKVDEFGVEIIEMHPYLTKREARMVRIRMKKAFPMNNYVVLNVPTFLGKEEAL